MFLKGKASILKFDYECSTMFIVTLQVTFEPKECIGYSEQLTIACDNGQAKTLTLLGIKCM